MELQWKISQSHKSEFSNERFVYRVLEATPFRIKFFKMFVNDTIFAVPTDQIDLDI